MDTFIQDLRDTLRGIRRRPGFGLAVIVSVGLGLGALGAVFSLVDAVLIRPLPYPGVERVMGVWFQSPTFPGGLDRVRQSMGTYALMRDQGRVFDAVGLADEAVVTVDDGSNVRRDPAAKVTGDLFQVLGVSVQSGRPLTSEDSEPGAEPVVVVSDGYWRRQMGADPEAVGGLLDIDGVQRRVVGVLPPAVRFPTAATDLWVPLEIDPARFTELNFLYTSYVRLKPGVEPATAEADLMRLVNLLPDMYPEAFPRPLLERFQLSILSVPLQDELVGDVRQPLLLVLLAAAVLLLIVVANVTSLFVVRNEGRVRDFAVRSAAGAPGRRIVRGFLTEGVVYGAAGAVVGLALAVGGVELLRRFGTDTLPRLHEVGLGWRSGTVIVALAVGLGLVVGSVAAVRLRSVDLGETLRSGGKSLGGGHAVSRVRRILVSAQVALALVLLADAGLLIRTLGALQAVPTGIQAEGRLGLRVHLSEREYPTFDDVRRFHHEVVDELSALPGVRGAAAATFLPQRDGRIFVPFVIEGNQESQDLPQTRLVKQVTEGFFQTLGIPVLDGRALQRTDAEGEQNVVVVSKAFADLYWPDGGAVGRRIGTAGQSEDWLEIVGVVGDVRDRELTQAAPPIVYAPIRERLSTNRWREMSYVVRASNPEALIPAAREIVTRRNRTVPVYDVRTMEQVLTDATARSRYTMLLLIASAGTALFLATVGLYGVLAHVVNERRREMALRLALGATGGQVRTLVLRQALVLVGGGLFLGLALTAGSSRAVESLLYGVPALDPVTLVGVVLLLSAVAWVAAAGPARRASTVPPAETLKEE